MWSGQCLADERWRDWLRCGGSLTQRLRQVCGTFAVRRLCQGAGRLHADEAGAVGLPPGAAALMRDVLLEGDGRPLVFGHSVVAIGHLDGPWRALRRLGCRPLAEALYADRRIARSGLEFRRLARAHPLHQRLEAVLGAQPDRLWARRSLFFRDGAPLLVTEVFLPALLERSGGRVP